MDDLKPMGRSKEEFRNEIRIVKTSICDKDGFWIK
jgi:hypothetical protein